jgi:hypothetical protein
LNQTNSSSDYTATADAIACAIVVAVGAIVFQPYLFSHNALYWGDIELYFAPMQGFLRENLSRGLVPLWNPYILCGQPFVGDPQISVLYPATIFAELCSSWRYLTVDAAVHIVGGGLMFYALARDQSLSRGAAVLASLTFMLGGYFVTKVQFPNMVEAIAWAPAIVWRAGRLGQNPNGTTALILGVPIGLQILASHPQIVMMTLALSLAYALWVARSSLTVALGPRRLFGWGALSMAIGLGLAAGKLLPDVEFFKYADHHTLSLAVANRFVMEPGEQIGLIWPWAYGSPYFGNFRQLGNFWEPACYLGIAPCVAMLFGSVLAFKRKRGAMIFWFVVFVVSMWLAEGRLGGLYTIAFYAIPAVRAFHDPARMLLGAAVAGPILAGYGFDWALSCFSRVPRTAALVVLTVLIAFDLGHFDRCAYPLKSDAELERVASTRAGRATIAAPGHRIAFPPDNRATWLYFADYDDFRRSDPTYLSSLFATRTSNVGMFDGTYDAGGYEPEPPRGAGERYIAAYNSALRGDYRGMDALCVDSFITIRSGGDRRMPGYFGTHSMTVHANPDRSAIARARADSGRYLPVRDIDCDKIAVGMPANEPISRIVVSDTDMPGWRAYASGVPVAVRCTANGFREVAPPPDRTNSSIIFVYRPNSWRLGLFVSLISLALVIGCGLHAVLSFDRGNLRRASEDRTDESDQS